jgi:hypothetical protein
VNTFFKHYWSLFIDFIDDFQEIKYKGIPLPLFPAFHLYIDDKINAHMKMESFGETLRNKIQEENQIQPHFDRFLNTIMAQNSNVKKEGKILIHDGDWLRFPPDYLSTFDKSKTEFLFSVKMKNSRSYRTYIQNLEKLGTVHILDNYRDDVTGVTNELIKNTQSLFSRYHDHPVYANKNFQNKFIEDIPLMVDLLTAYDNFFNKVDISCVIVGNTKGMFSRILSLMAKSKGILSICTQHGIIGNELGYMPAFASKYAVFGPYEQRWYQQQGVSSNSIEITGHPRFDSIFTRKHISKTEFCKNLQISPEKYIVFIASNLTSRITNWAIFFHQLAKNPQLTIIIKPHPAEAKKLGINHYKAISSTISSKYPSVHLVPPSMDLYHIIANADIVVQELSTVGLEALLFGKPVFSLRKEEYYVINDRYYYENLAKFTHYDPVKLAKMIIFYLENNDIKKEYTTIKEDFLADSYPQKLSGPKFHEFLFRVTGINTNAKDKETVMETVNETVDEIVDKTMNE